MIDTPLLYLLLIVLITATLGVIDRQYRPKLFNYLPVVVLIYASSMALSPLIDFNAEIDSLYKTLKSNLLPAMLFLMLLSVDIKLFFKLSRSLIIAYVSATLSIALSFVAIFYLFGFGGEQSGIFATLSASWMGGSANMIAVASALHVKESDIGTALILDSILYGIWVMTLLAAVTLAPSFNRFTKAKAIQHTIEALGCACTIGTKRYYLLLLFALIVAFISQVMAHYYTFISPMTTSVLTATLLGLIFSQTKAKEINGSSELSTSMLYLLIALIGSKSGFDGFDGMGIYLMAAAAILILHAIIMIALAKAFKLDLFSIGVASLANIGGVASAPILAASYHKSLASVGVLMAIMGYLVGTFGGLMVAKILGAMG